MAVNLFRTGRPIRYPDHWVHYKYYDLSDPSGYIGIKPEAIFYYYLQFGGIIKDQKKFVEVFSILFSTLMEHMVYEGVKIEFPFFGEIYVKEMAKYHNAKKERYRGVAGKKRHEMVYEPINYRRAPLNTYIAFFPILKNATRVKRGVVYKYRTYFGNALSRKVMVAKKRKPGLKYFKEVKK